jgi:hypothetical protein
MRSVLLIVCVATAGCVLDPTPYEPCKSVPAAHSDTCGAASTPAKPSVNVAAADGVGTTPSDPEP